MFNELKIKSKIKDYSLVFVDDFSKALIEASSSRSFFIIDQNVFNLYKNQFKEIIQQDRYLVVEATEFHKTLDHARVVVRFLISKNIKRNDKVIAVGGGIIQDVAGFVSSILFRGIEWFFFPTTLLAQSDSCIGSKTSINIEDFKNQLGTFYPPSQIVLDVNFLKTLSMEDLKSGLGEIIKVHLLDGEDSMRFIGLCYDQAFSDPKVIKELIFRSLKIKQNIIEKDEFDKDLRNILNYGHTFGHAIESVTNYQLSHGQAITIGMDIANYISFKKGLLSKGLYEEMKKLLLKNYPDFLFGEEQKDPFLIALSKDKKNVAANLNAILTEGPGKMKRVELPFDEVLGVITSYLSEIN